MADTHRDADYIHWHIALSILILKGPFGSWTLILCGDAFLSISTFHGLDFDVPYEWIFLEFLVCLYGPRRPVSVSTFCPFRSFCLDLNTAEHRLLITLSRIFPRSTMSIHEDSLESRRKKFSRVSLTALSHS